ncbi:MAG: glutathione S-transferase family protein [Chroococcidiopsidaceae cyanobacterium CP_BM_RX_35]|nr:glutathione S-transferase family protein [Chroococcidiopsidaceae cyanobacterium CP_BM_RX_35]
MPRTLYYTQRSPYARKVRIVLAEKRLPCQLQETDIKNKSPEFLSLSPIGKVPVLVDEDGLVLWDSTLIVEYLDETYPKPAFYPSARLEKVRCRQGEELADTLTDTIVGLWYEVRKGDGAKPAVQTQHQSTIERLLGVFEQKLKESPYLLNNTLTAVDIAAVSGIGYYSLRFGKDWQQQYPKLAQWFEQLYRRESVQSTVPRE